MSRAERRAMVERDRPAPSLSRQCRLLSIGRSSLCYEPKGESAGTLALMRRIDELLLKYPFYGARQMVRHLRREGVRIGRRGPAIGIPSTGCGPICSRACGSSFCTDALEEALARYGAPEIFNTDQGSRFTGFAFTARLQAAGIRISMDGRGRCMDNIFIENRKIDSRGF